MSDHGAHAGQTASRHQIWSVPGSAVGWWAIGLTLLIFPVAWVLMSHAIPWPLLDTAFSPVLIVVIIDAAAAAAVVSLRNRERSVLVLLSAVVALPLALYATVMLVLEALFPH